MAWPPSACACVSLKAPRYALPIGVRAVDTTTASLISAALPSQSRIRRACRDRNELFDLVECAVERPCPAIVGNLGDTARNAFWRALVLGQENALRLANMRHREDAGTRTHDHARR